VSSTARMYLAGVILSCSPVAVQAVVWHWGHMRMSLAVAVQMLASSCSQRWGWVLGGLRHPVVVVISSFNYCLKKKFVSKKNEIRKEKKTYLWPKGHHRCPLGLFFVFVVPHASIMSSLLASPLPAEDIAGGGCANTMGYCKVHVDSSSL